MEALLSTTYFGPVQWYQKLNRYDRVLVERFDSYRKQTFRNRCVIATTNGLQALSIPVERPSDGLHGTLIKDLRISDHGHWRHLHWHALTSAYSESPFFEYYADDIRPFFERKWDYLFDFNMEICQVVCHLLDIRPDIKATDYFMPIGENVGAITDISFCNDSNAIVDFREVIDPKHPLPDAGFTPRSYYQVYERKLGFQPNLSILDLLFNMGPEGIFYL